ncbi:MAG: GNAT family N-acetyltransferase [Microbacteriaceae bacterium]
MTNHEVVHAAEESQYRLLVDGEQSGLIDYSVRGNTIHLTHTEVDPSKQNNGLGGTLVQGALDQIRAETAHRVAPDCPFVAEWIDGHPEYQDLLNR